MLLHRDEIERQNQQKFHILSLKFQVSAAGKQRVAKFFFRFGHHVVVREHDQDVFECTEAIPLHETAGATHEPDAIARDLLETEEEERLLRFSSLLLLLLHNTLLSAHHDDPGPRSRSSHRMASVTANLRTGLLPRGRRDPNLILLGYN